MLSRLTTIAQSVRHHARLPMRKISGFEKASGRPLDILYAGTASQLAFVRSRFFGRVSADACVGTHLAPLVNRVARREGCQMTVAVQQSSAKGLLPRSGYLLPLWITSTANCSTPLEDRSSTSLKTDLKKIRKNGLSFAESEDPADFWYFWDRMHVPYSKAVHGEQALIGSREDFAHQLEQGELRLFFIIHDGQRVAGSVANFARDIPFFRYLGILDADPNVRKLGVLPALYIFRMELARQQGYSRVNFGGSRPFLNDGVVQFKKKFDMRLENRSCRRVLYIDPLEIDEAVTRCLASNPLIRLDGRRLVTTIFEDENGASPVSDNLWQFGGELLDGLERVERVTLRADAPPCVRTLSPNHP